MDGGQVIAGIWSWTCGYKFGATEECFWQMTLLNIPWSEVKEELRIKEKPDRLLIESGAND